MGIPITAHTPLGAARQVLTLADQMRRTREAADPEAATGTATGAAPRVGTGRGSDVHLCNAYTLALADRDPELGDVLRSASLNLPDGQPVVWANRLLHRDKTMPGIRVYGPDLVLNVFELSQGTGLRHYLLGSTPQVLGSLRRELHRRFPRAVIAGACSPPFRPLTMQERRGQEEEIRACGADIVWVGLGTPLQDRKAAELCVSLPVVAVAVGAAFDFIAGTKRQAPSWMQCNGLEWLFRLGCEPRRLWRRYLFGNARFLQGVACQALGKGVLRSAGAGSPVGAQRKACRPAS
ncbi:WecB/TagA/CpsF family glycosyltransferase [Streptomyces himalayensis]|uniref:WecB/TagA/CpsF family glycosyltransferase n=1 Tax=Streptomyces himalayensis subsp. himalayensis TaxID=2756131 RepID=A0A7W0DID7_9ACTN|nr:WecB/TagA/CpsF family glycosyltransferase [Streptomyces himalayensis]MBA2945208.1 WecB/TagA/CpsF family glycosyltransferase [Streptomyces himalayensis subsp. himalayensis]